MADRHLAVFHSDADSGLGDKFAGWCALLSILAFLVAIWPMMKFMPPISPASTVEEVAAHYQAHNMDLRLGAMMIMIAAGLLIALYAAMGAAILRMKGRPLALAATALASGTVVSVSFLQSGFYYGAAAFRPDRLPTDIQALNDLAWFYLIMPAPPACMNVLVFGLAILADDKQNPVMPRWLGYFNLWMAVTFFPGLVMVLAQTGPLAWNNVFPFWIPLATFTPWCVIMGIMFIRHGGRVSRGEFTPTTAL